MIVFVSAYVKVTISGFVIVSVSAYVKVTISGDIQHTPNTEHS